MHAVCLSLQCRVLGGVMSKVLTINIFPVKMKLQWWKERVNCQTCKTLGIIKHFVHRLQVTSYFEEF